MRTAPIVLRGSAVDDVIIDGELRMDGRSHVWADGGPSDGGASADASALDGGSAPGEVSGGCGCRAAVGGGRASVFVLLFAAPVALVRRRKAGTMAR